MENMCTDVMMSWCKGFVSYFPVSSIFFWVMMKKSLIIFIFTANDIMMYFRV